MSRPSTEQVIATGIWHRLALWLCPVLIAGGVAAGRTDQTATAEIGGSVRVTQIAPRYHLISDQTANLLVLTADDGSLVAGVQRPSLIAEARATLARLHAAPVRYVMVLEDTLSDRYQSTLANGDGGWGRDGAITLSHEQFHYRMAKFGRSKLTNPIPLISFSHVVQVFLAGEDVHSIHDRRGYSDGDLVLHFEKEGLLYLGNTFTTDGYPAIDRDRRGSVAGLIETTESFLRDFKDNLPRVEPIVPARGPVGTFQDLQAYRDMLAGVRDRVQEGIAAGRTQEEIIATRPTREFDARWGQGPIPPNRFVEMVYHSLVTARPAPTPVQHNHR